MGGARIRPVPFLLYPASLYRDTCGSHLHEFGGIDRLYILSCILNLYEWSYLEKVAIFISHPLRLSRVIKKSESARSSFNPEEG